MEEGEVVVGFAVAAGVDPAFGFEPGVGAFDGPAVACLGVGGFDVAVSAAPDFAGWCAFGDRVAGAAAFADVWFDLAVAEGLFERFGVVAAVGPELAGLDLAVGELVEQWEEVALLAFRCPGRGGLRAGRRWRLRRGGSGCLVFPGMCARPSRPFFRVDQRGVDDHA